jgi:hypothetical protein
MNASCHISHIRWGLRSRERSTCRRMVSGHAVRSVAPISGPPNSLQIRSALKPTERRQEPLVGRPCRSHSSSPAVEDPPRGRRERDQSVRSLCGTILVVLACAVPASRIAGSPSDGMKRAVLSLMNDFEGLRMSGSARSQNLNLEPATLSGAGFNHLSKQSSAIRTSSTTPGASSQISMPRRRAPTTVGAHRNVI